MRRAALYLLIALGVAVAAIAQSRTPAKPVSADVMVRTKTLPLRVAGSVTQWDDKGVTLAVAGKERTILWADMVGASAVGLREKLIDKAAAADWFDLGSMAWSLGVKERAKSALAQAAKLDKSLQPRCDDVMKGDLGAWVRGPAVVPTTSPDNGDFPTPTDEEIAAAIEHSRELSASVGEKLNVKFEELQTDHFIAFTDWDKREHAFLKTNLEAAYSAVAKQFDSSPKSNIFVGKLPIFMFSKQKNFQSFARKIDGFFASDLVMGYYRSQGDGSGHMAMWKPTAEFSTSKVSDQERMWAYTLTHEFTHAFLDRYRSPKPIPRWMNEGIAEVIAQGQFPRNNPRSYARNMSQTRGDTQVDKLFDNDVMPGGEWYPVMQTMVETLVVADRQKFLKLVAAIKGGQDAEAAMKETFGVDESGLIAAWRKYVAKARD